MPSWEAVAGTSTGEMAKLLSPPEASLALYHLGSQLMNVGVEKRVWYQKFAHVTSLAEHQTNA